MTVTTRAVTWLRYDDLGAEYAEIALDGGRLRARSTAVGASPVPYRSELVLKTGSDLVTSRLAIETRGLGWSRRLDLRRSKAGAWTVGTAFEGAVDLPDPGGDMSAFENALDPDVELCPVLNTLPVLRHGLLEGGSAPELLMIWVELPSLALHRSLQRYTSRGPDGDRNHVVRFEERGPDGEEFVQDIVFDRDGIVLDYPEIARRIG